MTNKNNKNNSKSSILIINIIFLFFNISIFIKINKNENLFQIIFKNSDYFNMNLLKRKYQHISEYLNNKYNNSNNMNLNEKNARIKKVIKIKGTGLYNKKNNLKWLKRRLDDKFIIKYDDPNPDYLIYNSFDSQDISQKYKNAIRIAIYTENIYPDMNYADYILAHYHINYLDRYFKQSVFLWKNLKAIKNKRLEVINNPIRKHFCAAVITNCKSLFRLNFIKRLNKYKNVDMGGRCNNNIHRKVKKKIEFLSKYKFSIAMENSKGDGYISEKIVDSFLAGTIPIYYGDYIIDEYINPKTYILIKGEKDVEEKIEYIKKIDNDNQLYFNILKENPIIDEKFINKIDKKEIGEFLFNIFNQDKNKAYRRDDNYYDFNCRKQYKKRKIH